jgi:iron(III) transport system ATP-binding protein
VGVMRHGQVEQWDSAYNLYHRPATRFVADFVGEGVLVDTVIEGKSVSQLLRPDDVLHDDESPTRAEVLKKAFRGAEFLYTLRLEDGKQVLSLVPSHHNHAIGERIGVKLDVDHVVSFPRD